MDSIIRQLYLLLGAGAVVFLLTGGAVGYLIGFRKASKIYKQFTDYVENDFMEEIKNQTRG